MAVSQLTLEDLRSAGLADVDPEIADLLQRELERQRGEIELIASENFTLAGLLEAVGNVGTNKYSEGYPGRRYYGGCEVVDEIEQLAIDRAKALFGAEHANVQPHAGAQTNMAVYFACLQPGDTILSLELSHGGHLTHGLKVNFSGRLYQVVHYGVSRETNVVDYDDVLALAREHRPKLIVCGGSAYPRTVEAERFREIADDVGALLLCDMAHFAGLVAAGIHPSPVPHCDFVTSTTHKTLAGPRSGFILCKAEHAQAVDRAVFPGMQGGPLNHVIAAKAACFLIASSEPFRRYQESVRANADVLAETLQEGGLDVLTGGTDTIFSWSTCAPRSGRARTRRSDSRWSESPSTGTRCLSTSLRRRLHPAFASGRPRRRSGASTRTTSGRSGGSCAMRSGLILISRRWPREAPFCASGDRSIRGKALPDLRKSQRVAVAGTPHLVTSGIGTVTEVTHPLVQHKLGLLRDVQTTTQMFRQLVNELTLLLTYEATKDLADEEIEIETPLEVTAARRISGKKVAVCPILRAGVGMLDAVLSLVPGARAASSGSSATRRRSSPSSTS